MSWFYTYWDDVLYYKNTPTENDFLNAFQQQVHGTLEQGEIVHLADNEPTMEKYASSRIKSVSELQS